MKYSFSKVMRLCLCGIVLQKILSFVGLPFYICALGSLPMLYGLIRLSELHDGFRSAFVLLLIRFLLIGAGAIPILRAVLWESIWSWLIPICHWIALTCMADGFWSVRLSRGLQRNRSAAATVLLQILLDVSSEHGGMVLFSSTALFCLAALWYYDRAARELDVCEDPPML